MFVRGTRQNAASSLPINYHSRETMHRQISSCLVVTVPVAYGCRYTKLLLLTSRPSVVYVCNLMQRRKRERDKKTSHYALCVISVACTRTVNVRSQWRFGKGAIRQFNTMACILFTFVCEEVKDRVLVQRNERATASVTSSQVSPIRITGKCVCMCLW